MVIVILLYKLNQQDGGRKYPTFTIAISNSSIQSSIVARQGKNWKTVGFRRLFLLKDVF